ncbi:MAG: filamentation induced by cAMP protein Fic [Firmicutes bacterium]|nr:filamentation induced by cAMP protein Fic [Bacillota bacterium]
MLFKRTKSYEDIVPARSPKELLMLVEKLLPDVVYNMASLERNPFTYPEVKTLMDGVTVGGHKLSDEQQVLSIRNGWNYVIEAVLNDKVSLDIDTFNTLSEIIAKEEALVSGRFRTGDVRIGGTDFIPPRADELESIFETELPIIIERCSSKTDLAFEIFLWVSLNQFYYDGNKRISRLAANMILISCGQGILNVRVKDRLQFNILMVRFYNTMDADEIFGFLYDNCLERDYY